MRIASRQMERYRLNKELSNENRRKVGRQTFLAEDTDIQEFVIIKIIRLDQAIHTADQWVELKLFERESQGLQMLNHPALPKYKDAFETDIEGIRSFVLVQSYLEADSLETQLQSGKRFSAAEVLDIARQLLTTLIYLHAQTPPVIHRDIKPSNILLGPSDNEADGSIGDVYLIDFGAIHTDLTKESGTITIVGSYGYIPLEQFAGQAVPASDLYSLGMTLIHLVTDTHPADIAHINGKIQLPGHSLQPALARWLEKMTHPDLNSRFHSAEQALIALQSEEYGQGSAPDLKPEDTKVVVKRERDRIQISMDKLRICPPKLVKSLIIVICVAAVLLRPFSFFYILFHIPIFLAFFVFFNVPKRARAIKLPFCYLLQSLPGPKWQTVIEIDRKRGIRMGTRRKKQTAVKWGKWTSSFEDLDLLIYNPGYRFDEYTRGNKTITQKGDVLPGLSVNAGEISYPIGHSQLAAAEFWWLGQELSDFLGLDLQTIYPMPIVTVTDTSSGGCGC